MTGVVPTPGNELFQAANNTAVMMDVHPDRGGVVSGLPRLPGNLGFITGASVLGVVFALAAGTSDITTAATEAVSAGVRITFAVAAGLVGISTAISIGGRFLSTHPSASRDAT